VLSASVPAAEVVAISDALPESGRRIADEVGAGAVYTDALELIGDPRVDAVIVASPAETHEEFVLACLDAGKPVLCEKPLAAGIEAARRVLDAETALGRRLVTVGFMRRFDPGYADLKRRLDAGEVGRPLLVHCAHRNPAVPPSFGSRMIITDTVVHEMDTVRWLTGQEIVRVTVLTPRPSGLAAEGVRDPQLVLFETDAGLIADVEAFVNAQYGYDIRCEVVGETGTLSLAAPATGVPSGFQERFASAYRHELEAWLASAAGGPPAGASAWDGYAAAVVSDACVQSLDEGARVEVVLDAATTTS
jgi:myo-inositol 2-dehydrogenase/D-chiro-inositol 1-dehydrogenase